MGRRFPQEFKGAVTALSNRCARRFSAGESKSRTFAIDRRALLTSLVIMPLLAACGGGGADSETEIDVRNTTVSKGQALIDLKKALDAGAMSKTEYNRAKAAVLEEK
jgi:hypothetical protein